MIWSGNEVGAALRALRILSSYAVSLGTGVFLFLGLVWALPGDLQEAFRGCSLGTGEAVGMIFLRVPLKS